MFSYTTAKTAHAWQPGPYAGVELLILHKVEKTGALGPMQSIYFRDPDGNLIEVSKYDDVPR